MIRAARRVNDYVALFSGTLRLVSVSRPVQAAAGMADGPFPRPLGAIPPGRRKPPGRGPAGVRHLWQRPVAAAREAGSRGLGHV